MKPHVVLIMAIVAVPCAAALTTTLPAAAQADPAPAPAPEGTPEAPPAAPEGSPEAAPAAEQADPAAAPEGAPEAAPAAPEGSSEAAPAAPEASPEATPDAPEGSPDAEALPEDPEAYEGEMEEVVVTGFGRSLTAALGRKQRSTGQVDAIVAEDIADFPDLNLAESLQRVPGVAITRTNGEGNQITVRGLSGLYTRVRVNGMEARSNIGNSAGAGGGRSFDFNLFASELFNSVVVHKTASADLEEGSLGAVIDLNTARAFNYDEGWTFVAGGQGSYNDLSNTLRPRLTGLVAYRDPGGLWGATASAAYTRVRLDTAYADTVGWQKARFNSVDGVACAVPPAVETDPGCLDVTDAFHPRIPRYGQDSLRGDRLGLTAGFQIRPTDQTEIRLDGLYATYGSRNDQRRLFMLFRGNEGTFDISDPVFERFPDRFGVGNDTLVAATVNNGWARNEHVRLDAVARFHQLSLALDHHFTDSVFLNALAGTSRSKSGLPHDTTVQYDIRPYGEYRYDFRDQNQPLLAFNGQDVNDPTQALVTELRDRVGDIQGGFDTAELNLGWDLVDQLKLAAGTSYKVATADLKQSNRDGLVCGLTGLLYDCDTDGDGTDDVLGPPATAEFSSQLEFIGDAGAGSTTRWASPGIDNWANSLGYYDVPLVPNQNATYKIVEKALGFYLQARGEVLLGVGDMRFLYDAGARYVETRQSSTGYVTGALVTTDRPTYHDWLPSANTALWLTDELVVRLAAARVMARPGLVDLGPGAAVDGFGYTINFQNPRLDPTRATALDAATEWYFADGSLLSLAVFYKDIDSFPIRQSRRGTFASSGLPRTAIVPTTPADVSGPEGEGTCGDPAGCWTISELTNGPGSKLKGLEVGFQAPFSSFYGALPPVIRSMGILANYTYVDSTADYDFVGNSVKERIIGLSNGQYNATLYYDDSTFDARVSLAYRSDYLDVGPNSTGNLWEYVESSTRVDASAGYNVTENLKVSLEALNLTDAPFARKIDVDAERRFLYTKAGRTYLLGARVSF